MKITPRILMEHGWLKAKRHNNQIDWLYPGDMQPRTFEEACEITADAYPEKYQVR